MIMMMMKQTKVLLPLPVSSSAKLAFLVTIGVLFINLKSSSVALRSSLSRRRETSSRPTGGRASRATHFRSTTAAAAWGGTTGQPGLDIRTHEEHVEISNEEKWLREVKERGTKGNIAWLMSFPNSGTSFTSLLVRHASNTTTATNYGMESHLGRDGKSVPVYDWSTEGPYWLHPPGRLENSDEYEDAKPEKGVMTMEDHKSGTKLGKSGNYPVPPASASILTKTHCGGRCASCPPSKYLETSASFLKMCLTGSRKVPKGRERDGAKGYEKQYHTYHPSLVAKAVHLVRDPFDNLVSRFHHERKEHRKRGDARWTSRYANDAAGFRRWCADEDARHATEDRAADWRAHGLPADTAQLFAGVPCHGDFLRYVRWHDLALRAVERLGVPARRVHYEEYAADLRAATAGLLEFLGLQGGGEMPRFDVDKDYAAYFTREERASASDFMRRVASARAEELLGRYWVKWDFEQLAKQTKSIK